MLENGQSLGILSRISRTCGEPPQKGRDSCRTSKKRAVGWDFVWSWAVLVY